MRTFVRSVLLTIALTSASLTSASLALACPIDLAPCEVAALHEGSVPISHPDENMLSSNVGEKEVIAPLQTVLLHHEGDGIVADGQIIALVLQNGDVCFEITDALLILTAKGEVQGDAEELAKVDHTASVGPSAITSLAEPELALDGYEDR